MPVRRFRTEGPVLYERYQFGYCEWLELEGTAELAEAYGGGFLPYSAAPEDPRQLFYMARSLRVNLAGLALDKKRRYDHRAWQDFGPRLRVRTRADFLGEYGDRVQRHARDWMQARFGGAFLSEERLAHILAKPFLGEVLVWTIKGELAAFALVVCGAWGAHYWYCFYRNGDPLQHAPGHGYLVDFIEWARAEGLPFAYLGTAYGLKSRYKSRGLAGVEFWDGNQWDPDKERLAQLQAGDDARPG